MLEVLDSGMQLVRSGMQLPSTVYEETENVNVLALASKAGDPRFRLERFLAELVRIAGCIVCPPERLSLPPAQVV